MNIYVPDDLAEQVKQHDDLNVSAVCQDALRAELDQRKAAAELGEKVERVEVFVDRSPDFQGDVAFTGKEIYYDGRHTTAYLTKRGRIAVHNSDEQSLYDFDSFLDFTADDVWELQYPAMVSAVAEALGLKHVIELDI